MSEETKGAWAVVGKVAVVIGILLGLITIYKTFFNDGPVLRAQGAHYPIFYSQKSHERRKVSPDTIQRYLPFDLKEKEKVSEDIAEEVNRDVGMWDLETRLEMVGVKKVVEINISNTGNREGQDLTIEFDTSGTYELRRVGETVKRDSFEQVIKLGNVRPNNTISLIVWPGSFSDYSEKSVKITHTLGTLPVEFAFPINGWMAFPYRWSGTLVLISILLLYILLSIVSARAKKKVTPPTSTKEEESKESATEEVKATETLPPA